MKISQSFDRITVGPNIMICCGLLNNGQLLLNFPKKRYWQRGWDIIRM